MTSLRELGFGVARQIRAARATRMRRLPPLRATQSAAGSGNIGPTVYYLTSDTDRPVGGNRTIYRHVDALNSGGISAVVINQSGIPCSWFAHKTPVLPAKSITLTPHDILVVPEFYGSRLHELPIGPRVVIFNQNAYQTFAGINQAAPGAPYRRVSGIEAIVVVSHDSANYLQYAFPELRIERVRNAVDGSIFHPGASPPGRRIAVMPRRRAADCDQVLHLLRARGCLNTWEVVKIEGYSERETAAAMQSCAIFLSFSEREGFGMPPAEAMACGCYVIGFTGLGGARVLRSGYIQPDRRRRHPGVCKSG